MSFRAGLRIHIAKKMVEALLSHKHKSFSFIYFRCEPILQCYYTYTILLRVLVSSVGNGKVSNIKELTMAHAYKTQYTEVCGRCVLNYIRIDMLVDISCKNRCN